MIELSFMYLRFFLCSYFEEILFDLPPQFYTTWHLQIRGDIFNLNVLVLEVIGYFHWNSAVIYCLVFFFFSAWVLRSCRFVML